MKTSGLRKKMKAAAEKRKQRRTKKSTVNPKTGEVTKKITKKSGATTTKTYKKDELRPSKVVKTRGGKRTGMVKKTVEGKGMDKQITKYDRKGKKKYTTTPRKRLKKAGESVKGLGKIAAVGTAATMLPGGAKRALLDAAKLGGGGITAMTGGKLGEDAKKGVKKGVKKLKAKIKGAGKKLRSNIVSRVQGTRKKKKSKKRNKK